MLAAVRHDLPDRIPVDCICVENVPEIARYAGIPECEVIDRLGFDGRMCGSPAYGGNIPGQVEGEWLTAWGIPWSADYGTSRNYPWADAETVSDIESRYAPDGSLYDWGTVLPWCEEVSQEYALRGPGWYPVFCQVCDLMGMEEALVKMHVQPDVFDAAVERVFQHAYQLCEGMAATCGDHIPFLLLEDDFATQRGLMMSPEHWRKFLKPRYAQLFDIAKHNGQYVWFHSCGDITSVLPDLIDIGIDVWETVQLHTLPISAEKLKREYGRDITFFGGVNTQTLPFVSPAVVRDEVIRCIEVLGDGGGYICGPDHHIKPDVSAVNTLALFDTAVSYRGSGHTL